MREVAKRNRVLYALMHIAFYAYTSYIHSIYIYKAYTLILCRYIVYIVESRILCISKFEYLKVYIRMSYISCMLKFELK